jgi:pentatricopeptide repeat protein
LDCHDIGHVKCGQEQKALEFFQQMQGEFVELNPVTFMGLLNACTLVGALEEGKCAQGQNISMSIFAFNHNHIGVELAKTIDSTYIRCDAH